MTAEAIDLVDDDIEDLADIALAHPVVHKRLDLSRINVAETLSLGDIDDMARELGTDPARLASVLTRNPEQASLEVAIVLAWIIARKRDPDLDLSDVRRFWQVELVGVGKSTPNPTAPRTSPPPRSSGRRGSSRKRG